MLYLDKDKRHVVDGSGNILGEIRNGKFTQNTPELSKMYASGLLPVELEQVSEAMQRGPRAAK